MASKQVTLKVSWYIDRFNGEDHVVMVMGNRTRIRRLLPLWRRSFAKRYLTDHLLASKN